ncbi:uncharacterized protein LOC101859183 [Aplysia californica]|uniref:Uncharacterized protein LOC101859183 n=1 Tax=Aplysia californica TaxID=6500 RepID=A0ABM1VX26_APLCA|nr:uncharacterized protein LOC101859183 [Aplysia californica]
MSVSVLPAQMFASLTDHVDLDRQALDPEFNPWRPFGDCKFRDAEKGCGPGVKVRTRSVKERTDGQETRDPFNYEIRQEASCFEKCDDPEPQDQCPEEDFCEGNTYDPVCGSIDNGMLETFDNLCELERIACVADKPFNVQYNGKCKEDDGPEIRAAGISQITFTPLATQQW